MASCSLTESRFCSVLDWAHDPDGILLSDWVKIVLSIRLSMWPWWHPALWLSQDSAQYWTEHMTLMASCSLTESRFCSVLDWAHDPDGILLWEWVKILLSIGLSTWPWWHPALWLSQDSAQYWTEHMTLMASCSLTESRFCSVLDWAHDPDGILLWDWVKILLSIGLSTWPWWHPALGLSQDSSRYWTEHMTLMASCSLTESRFCSVLDWAHDPDGILLWDWVKILLSIGLSTWPWWHPALWLSQDSAQYWTEHMTLMASCSGTESRFCSVLDWAHDPDGILLSDWVKILLSIGLSTWPWWHPALWLSQDSAQYWTEHMTLMASCSLTESRFFSVLDWAHDPDGILLWDFGAGKTTGGWGLMALLIPTNLQHGSLKMPVHSSAKNVLLHLKSLIHINENMMTNCSVMLAVGWK